MEKSSPIDPRRCEALAARAAQGHRGAWQALVEHLWPALFAMVRVSRSMGAFGRSDDHVRDVLTRVLDKLGKNDARGLGCYAPWRERHPDKTFEDWIRIVTANAIRDHVRDQLGDAAAFEDASVKRLLNEFVSSPAIESLGFRAPTTDAQTARQLLEFARLHLPDPQTPALTLWIGGASFDDIAAELGLESAEAAARVVRAAVASLRRRFGTEKKIDGTP